MSDDEKVVVGEPMSVSEFVEMMQGSESPEEALRSYQAVKDPAAVLKIPTEEDIPLVMEMIQEMYDEVEEEYEHQDEPSEQASRQGSLAMELWAQLSNQGWSRYD